MYVSAVVDIENKGNEHTTLYFDTKAGNQKPFSVFRVDHKGDGSLKFKKEAAYPVPRAQNPNIAVNKLLVRAGGRETIPFHFRVSSPGVYLLVFRAPTSEKDQKLAEEEGGFRYRGAWAAKEYLTVERSQQKHSSWRS
jgi:hypothetical protein